VLELSLRLVALRELLKKAEQFSGCVWREKRAR